MSGRSIGTALGFVVGLYFGNPSLGATLGGMIGGAIDPDKVQGAKIGELPVQRSLTGGVQPVVLGTSLVDQCLVMWAGEARIVKEEEQQGKGGGPVVINEVLYQDYRIRVCRSSAADGSQVEGFPVIFEDGRLVYDTRPSPRISAADSAKWAQNVRFYFGGPTQDPDPTEEADVGVGNASAHRQISSFVKVNQKLTDFGNRIPTYEVVVSKCGIEGSGGSGDEIGVWLGSGQVAAGTRASARSLSFAGEWVEPADSEVVAINSTSAESAQRYGDSMFEVVTGHTNLRVAAISDLESWSNGPANPTASTGRKLVLSGDRLFCFAVNGSSAYYLDSPADTSWTTTGALPDGYGTERFYGMAGNGTQALAVNGSGQFYRSVADNGATWTLGAAIFLPNRRFTSSGNGHGPMDFNGTRFVIGFWSDVHGAGACYTDDTGATVTDCVFPSGVRNVMPMQVKHCGDGNWLIAFQTIGGSTDDGLYLATDNGVTFNPVDLPVPMYFDPSHGFSIGVDANSGRVVIAGFEVGTTTRRWYRTDDFITWTAIDLTDSVSKKVSEIYPLGSLIAYDGTEIPDAPGYYIDPDTGDQSGPLLGESDLCGTTLAEVVRYICSRGQLTDAELYLDELEDITVRGITLQSAGTCKDELDPLRQAHFFDPADFDSKLRFRVRGTVDVDIAIDADDLVFTEDDEEENRIIGQEVDLSRKHLLNYLSLDLDYLRTPAPHEFTSLDPSVVGTSDATINEVFSHEEATRISAIQHELLRMGNEGYRKFGLPMEYLPLVGASLVTLNGRRGRIDGYSIDLNAIWFDPVPYDRARAYDANVVAPVLTPPTGPGTSIKGPTSSVLLNVPVLNDANDRPGLIWAPRGYPNTAWSGAVLQLQRNGEWTQVDSTTRACNTGTLLSDLPAYDGTVDETNTLHISLSGGIDSITIEAFLNEGNPLAIQYPDGTAEIVQAQFATEITDDVYECTRLIRGRLDTVNGEHLAGAKVVFLNTALRFVPIRPDDIGKTLSFRAVSNGTDPAAAVVQTITLTTIESQREWQPYNIEIESDGSGGYCISWIGRARLGSDAFPIHSQYFDGYSVRLTDGVVIHDIETDEQSVCVTAAEMAAIFGGGYGQPEVSVVTKSTSSQQTFNAAAPVGWVALSGTWTEDPAGTYNLLADGASQGRMYYDTLYAFSSGTFDASVDVVGPILSGFGGLTVDFINAAGNTFLTENGSPTLTVTAASLVPFGTVTHARVYLRALSGSPLPGPVTFSSLSVVVTP